MKELTYKGVTYLYRIKSSVEDYDYVRTEFYSSTETEDIYRRKFFFFGPKIFIKTSPKFLFSLDFNIEDPVYVKEQIHNALNPRIERLTRAEEIKNGNIV